MSRQGILRAGMLAAALVFLGLGVALGEYRGVMQKAVKKSSPGEARRCVCRCSTAIPAPAR